MTVRKLTERQMRWSLILSRYKFKIIHIPGKDNERADALSRRDQDLPKDAFDNRLQDRRIQLLRPEVLAAHTIVLAMPVNTRKTRAKTKGTALRPSQEFTDAPLIVGELPDELTDWRMAVEQDDEYQAIRRAVGNRDRKMPSEYRLKVSIIKYTLSL